MSQRVACDFCGVQRDLAVDAFCECGHSACTAVLMSVAERQQAVIAVAQRIDLALSHGVLVFLGDELAEELHAACAALETTIH